MGEEEAGWGWWFSGVRVAWLLRMEEEEDDCSSAARVYAPIEVVSEIDALVDWEGR